MMIIKIIIYGVYVYDMSVYVRRKKKTESKLLSKYLRSNFDGGEIATAEFIRYESKA